MNREKRWKQFKEKIEREAEDYSEDPLENISCQLGILKSLIEYHYINGCRLETMIEFYLKNEF